MPLHDLTLTITEKLPTWPGEPAVKLDQVLQLEEGDQVNLTHISSSLHVGTHIDAPSHFLRNGQTVDRIPLDLLVGPARVIELLTPQTINADDLKAAGVTGKDPRLLIKTNNSRFWESEIMEFQEDFAALAPEAAAYLVACGVEVIGVDYLSVAPFHDPAPTHKILLEAGILVIEGLDLSAVKPGAYKLLCLPLKIGGADGAPARVLLEEL